MCRNVCRTSFYFPRVSRFEYSNRKKRSGLELTCTFTMSETLRRKVAVALFIELLLLRWRALAARAMAACMGFGSVRLDIFLPAVDAVKNSRD